MVKVQTTYIKNGQEVQLKNPKIELGGIGEEETVKFTAMYGQFYENKVEFIDKKDGAIKSFSNYSVKVTYHKMDNNGEVKDHEVYMQLSEAQHKSFETTCILEANATYEAYKSGKYVNFRLFGAKTETMKKAVEQVNKNLTDDEKEILKALAFKPEDKQWTEFKEKYINAFGRDKDATHMFGTYVATFYPKAFGRVIELCLKEFEEKEE